MYVTIYACEESACDAHASTAREPNVRPAGILLSGWFFGGPLSEHVKTKNPTTLASYLSHPRNTVYAQRRQVLRPRMQMPGVAMRPLLWLASLCLDNTHILFGLSPAIAVISALRRCSY